MSKRSLRLLVLVAIVSAPVWSQALYSHTLPAGYESQDGNLSSPSLWGTASNQRWQYVYDWTQFHHQCPQTITELAFRNSTDVVVAGGTYTGVTIQMGSATADHAQLSSFFAANLASDVTTVYQGDVVIPPHDPGGNPQTPAPWIVVITLQQPLAFDPTAQTDLIIDITTNGTTPSTATGFVLDWLYPTLYAGQYGNTWNPTSVSANWVNYNAAPIVQITYSLGSSQHFDLTATTSGGGAGDLLLQYDNIPASTAHGFTLVSLTPAPVYGKGPVFGILPDQLTWDIILTPAVLHNPLHWLWPAPGLFPDVLIYAPPASFSFTGTWELVGVALDPAGQVTGITAPQALTW